LMEIINTLMNKQILFRASRFGDLCGSVSKSELTPKQEIDLNNFIEREKAQSHIIRDLDGLPFKGSPKPLTQNQREEMNRLITKRDAPPELDVTARSWVEELFNENVRRIVYPNFSSIQTDHGNAAESSAIKRIAKVNGWGTCLKSTATLFDKYGNGHPDNWKPSINFGFEAKCSFTGKSFPLFHTELKNTDYKHQVKRYMMMAQSMGHNVESWPVCYSLENASDEVVMSHAQNLWKESGNSGFITDREGNYKSPLARQFYDMTKEMHTFDHLADWERVKTFYVHLIPSDIELYTKRAEMGLAYYAELEEKYKLMKK